ncbi:iron-sulfur cluster assembly scaffold protein [bacterium]|nr:iron-sulfur cluster assembly scaffold protein [bacterium]
MEAQWCPVAIDHARHPRHHGPLTKFNSRCRITGPCGDTMEFWLLVEGRRIVDASFTTDGCGCSLASGSVTATLAIGKTIAEAFAMEQRTVLTVLGGLPKADEHCALLAVTTLQAACRVYSESQSSSATGADADESA